MSECKENCSKDGEAQNYDCLGLDIPVTVRIRVKTDCGCEGPGGNGNGGSGNEGNGGSELTGGRIRVTEDLHVYVNGDAEESGDGLSAETAVATFAEAMDVINGYDGQGKFSAWVHFASLADGRTYEDVRVASGATPTFNWLRLQGEDKTSTQFGQIVTNHERCRISNLSVGYVLCKADARLVIDGDITITPYSLGTNGSISCHGGYVQIYGTVTVTGSGYRTLLRSAYCGYLDAETGSAIRVSGQSFSASFAEATNNGSIKADRATFTGSATGKRYNCRLGGCIYAASETLFPGNQAGTVASSGSYA